MKVGIITFHFVSNQGGVLQAYASQKFIEKSGHEASIIDYRPGYHTVRYASRKNPFTYTEQYWKKFQNRFAIKRVLLTVRSFARCMYMNIMHTDDGVVAAYEKFVKENLHLTRQYKSLKQLISDPPQLDAYVTGSDQLWNPEILDYKFDSAYFLPFGDKKIPKVAYAVSTGKNLTAKEEGQLKELAMDLTAVSLREFNESTVTAIGKDVHICIDPTLLLDESDYASVESKSVETEPYIFVYGFETTNEIKQAITLAMKKYSCKVINGSPHRIKLDGNVVNLRNYGPDLFLTLIKNASCVVTNSFHGTAFSIIYKKDFITVPHSTRGKRMVELLGKLNLLQRLWGTDVFSFEESIDWGFVYEELYILRKHSADYLLSAIQGVPGEDIPHWDEERSSIDLRDKYEGVRAYAGFLRNEKAAKESASGGAATALAEQFIEGGGAVVGAAYSEDFKSAEYVVVDSKEDLTKLKSSKYIPVSKTSGGVLIYELISKNLEDGKQVLFIGLPCDVGALKSWLKRKGIDDERLITVDLICHGPTLQKVQQDYIEQIEEKHGARVKSFTTRYVKNRWSLPCVHAELENGVTLTRPLYETDLGFALKYFARVSCYQCRFKGVNHSADITVGDFWGLKPDDERYNKNGVSVMLVRTQKGEQLLRRISHSRFVLFDADIHEVIKHNPMYEESARKPAFYTDFERNYKQNGLHDAVVHSVGYRIYRKAAMKNRLLLLLGKK